MDGLALYRLNRIPVQKTSVKRKISPQTVVPISQTGTDFTCLRCGEPISITKETIIQCQNCYYRILQKKRKDRVIVSAV